MVYVWFITIELSITGDGAQNGNSDVQVAN